jgi:hypothetical protein
MIDNVSTLSGGVLSKYVNVNSLNNIKDRKST